MTWWEVAGLVVLAVVGLLLWARPSQWILDLEDALEQERRDK